MSQVQLEINNRYKGLADPEAATKALFEALEQSGQFPISSGELSIAFVDDPEIAQVHADFMDDPTPTDVITFPADKTMDFAGEIIVSVDHAKAKAAELDLPFSRELSLYLIHGWLHLAGYNDLTEEERSVMRTAESEALKICNHAGTSADFGLTNDT